MCICCKLPGAEIKKELGVVTTIIADLPQDDDLRAKLEKAESKLKSLFEELLSHSSVLVALDFWQAVGLLEAASLEPCEAVGRPQYCLCVGRARSHCGLRFKVCDKNSAAMDPLCEKIKKLATWHYGLLLVRTPAAVSSCNPPCYVVNS